MIQNVNLARRQNQIINVGIVASPKINPGLVPSRLGDKFKLFVLIIKIILFCLIISHILYIFISVWNLYSINYPIDIVLNVSSNSSSGINPPSDPVRWWPSGVTQGTTSVGMGIATYVFLGKMGGISPRFRALTALGAAGVTTTQILYKSALDNSIGFNRLMWGYSEYKKNKEWPSIDKAYSQSDSKLAEFVKSEMSSLSESDKALVENNVVKIIEEVKAKSVVFNNSGGGVGSSSGSQSGLDVGVSDSVSDTITKFLPSSDSTMEYLLKIYENLFKEVFQFLQPVYLQGYFDDLVGQRMFIEFLLFILVILVSFLFMVFIFNLIILLNKDKIVKLFNNNKFITFYMKYYTFFSKITIFYLPIFIGLGLFTITHGLLWLLSNQIPYESRLGEVLIYINLFLLKIFYYVSVWII